MAKAASRVGRNAAVGAVSQMLMLSIGFITTPVVLWNVGVASFGVLAVVNSVTGYIGVLDLGIGSSLIRYMAFYQERGDTAKVGAFATFSLLFYIAFAAVFFPLVSLSARPMATFLRLPVEAARQFPFLISMTFALFVSYSVIGIFSSKLAAAHRLDLAAMAGLTGAVTNAILIISLIHRFPSVFFVILCGFAQVTVSGLCMYAATRFVSGPAFASPTFIERADLRGIFTFGFWSQLSSISAVVNLEADKVIISRGAGVINVAPYQVANRLALINRLLPLQVVGALLPEVTASVSRGASAQDLARLYGSSTRMLMIVTLTMTGFIAGSADPLLRLWLGVQLPGAASLCVALVVSYAVNNMTGVGTVIMKAREQPQYETYYGSLSALLNIMLTLLLIRRFGLFGVVGATIIGNVIGSVFFLFLFHRVTGISWTRTTPSWLLRLVVISASSSVAIHALLGIIADNHSTRGHLFVALALAGLSYLLIFLGLGWIMAFWQRGELKSAAAVISQYSSLARNQRMK